MWPSTHHQPGSPDLEQPGRPARHGWSRTAGQALLLSLLAAHPEGLPGTLQTGEAPATLPAGNLAPAQPAPDLDPGTLVARLFYGERESLAHLADRYDLLESADHDAGYVLALVTPAEQAELARAGFRWETDPAQTAALWRSPRPSGPGLAAVPQYPCYRTVGETGAALDQLAASHPDLARVVTIGVSWEKAQSQGLAGSDLRVLVLTRQDRPGPKPRFLLIAAHHAREMATAETATRFAEELVAGYDTDPDATWLLDHHEIHVLPQANPDGRRWAELGYWWRKNTCNTNGCSRFPDYGTDLNRNAGFEWGGIGSSALPCSELFRGPAAFSEPENQAIRDYARSLFPPQRPPDIQAPAPPDASGLLISLHSFGELVLYPWGWTTNAAPNQAGLAALGAKFGYFNRHAVQPATELYPTTGSLDDWAYGELGIAAYTFELGRYFFEPCADFTETVYPRNRDALWYAAKACREPYRAPAGPDIVSPTLATATNLAGTRLSLTAIADTSRHAGTKTSRPVTTVAAARFTVDEPSWSGTASLPLEALDGAFDSPRETVTGVLDTAGWGAGRHTVFLEARDADGTWGVPTAVFVWITPLTLTATREAGELVLRWPSVAGRSYAVVAAGGLDGPFTAVASGLPGQPPFNILRMPLPAGDTRFYRVQLEP